MPFQTAIPSKQGYGVVGEFAFDSPSRVQPSLIDPAATAANCEIGRVFTITKATGLYLPGGDLSLATIKFGGILGFPKENVLYGTANGGALSGSLLVKPGTIGSFIEMGMVIVKINGAANVGDIGVYTVADGTVGVVAPANVGAIPGTQRQIPNCEVYRTAAIGAGDHLVVFKLTN